MNNVPEKINKEDKPVYKIIQEIKKGRLEPRELSKQTRQACVEVLTLEGYSVSSIAQLVDKSEKTINRDLKQVWQKNSEKPSVELAVQMIGEMIQKSKVKEAHLMRLARSKEGSLQEKVQAEYCAWRVQKETVEKLQSLGYLPTQAQKVVGEIYHHQGEDVKTLAELKEELTRIEKITKENGNLDATTKKQIDSLRQKIEKAEIAQEITQLVKDKTSETKETDEVNEPKETKEDNQNEQ